MKIKILYLLLSISIFFGSCTDPDLDPVQFDNIKKATILGLRDFSYSRIAVSSQADLFLTGVDTFNILQDNSAKVFSFVCDFISEDQESLGSVDVYVVNKDKARVKVKSVPASEFKSGVAGTNFKRATISIPFTDLFKAAGKSICDYKPSNAKLGIYSFIDIENDINLTDGSIIPASSIVNSSLFESVIFYPAHKLRLIARGPAIENKKVDVISTKKMDVDLDKLLTQKVAGVTYKWETEGNPNVTGTTAKGTTSKIEDQLTNTSAKKQVVIYTVTPTLPNGCEGTPFTISVSVVLKVPCESVIGGMMDYETTGWCGEKSTGVLEFKEEENGIYNIFLNGADTPDFSMGAYSACYSPTAALPLGTLRLNEDCGTLFYTGASQWGEKYQFNSIKVEGTKLTLDWNNDYDPEAGVTVLVRKDGKNWPPLTK
jgi:PKD-like domain